MGKKSLPGELWVRKTELDCNFCVISCLVEQVEPSDGLENHSVNTCLGCVRLRRDDGVFGAGEARIQHRRCSQEFRGSPGSNIL